MSNAYKIKLLVVGKYTHLDVIFDLKVLNSVSDAYTMYTAH